jgi:hypothetical protein
MTISVDDGARTRRTTYIVLAVVLLLLAGVALLVYGSRKSAEEADLKADQFITELTNAGFRAPSKAQIVGVFGDHGGAACADPNSALRRGLVLGGMTNGAAGPGIRPVIADNRVLQGQLLTMKVYCPKELQRLTDFAHQFQYADVVKG